MSDNQPTQQPFSKYVDFRVVIYEGYQDTDGGCVLDDNTAEVYTDDDGVDVSFGTDYRSAHFTSLVNDEGSYFATVEGHTGDKNWHYVSFSLSELVPIGAWK